jgi:light-regulated signal transduction histidine kinase (bacteriophytochrome)
MRYDTKRIVKWSVAPGMIIAGDINLLRIALTNLIGNAWKFTSKRDEAHIEIGTTNDPDRGRAFFVRDNGAGFDPTYADKLFVAFQRLHTQQEYPGMGIGLATVLRAVRRHGGIVWAKSEPDRGAAFYFTIPAIQTSIHRKEEQA